MRRFNPSFVWLLALLSIWVPQVLNASPARGDDWAKEYIRTHPGYRGYLTPRPPYPLISRAKHEQGDSVARVTFAKEGQVIAVKLIKSTGYWNLDSNSVNYIKAQWRSTFGQVKTLDVPMNYRLH